MRPGFAILPALNSGFVVQNMCGLGERYEILVAGSLADCLEFIRSHLVDHHAATTTASGRTGQALHHQ